MATIKVNECAEYAGKVLIQRYYKEFRLSYLKEIAKLVNSNKTPRQIRSRARALSITHLRRKYKNEYHEVYHKKHLDLIKLSKKG